MVSCRLHRAGTERGTAYFLRLRGERRGLKSKDLKSVTRPRLRSHSSHLRLTSAERPEGMPKCMDSSLRMRPFIVVMEWNRFGNKSHRLHPPDASRSGVILFLFLPTGEKAQRLRRRKAAVAIPAAPTSMATVAGSGMAVMDALQPMIASAGP